MKNIFTMVATAIILASCSQAELEETSVGQKEIKFSNLNDKVTRAANDNNSNYKVYAVWSGATNSNWFINDVVDGTTNLPQNGPYYWPTTGTVDFYSWAPATVTATGTYPALSIAYTVPTNAAEDFTIANPKTGLSASTVAFEFAHKLAKISVTASLSQDLITAGYTLTTTGLTANLGVQSTGGTIVPTTADAAWTAPNATAASYTGAASYMIMPQSSIGCTIQVTAGIVVKDANDHIIYSGNLSQYTIKSGDVPAVGTVSANTFGMGKHYMLNLTIADDSTGGGGEDIFNIITFSANVADWDTVGGTDTPLPQP